jgi:ribosomal protein S18 acetylase RimI-like enzyme
MRITHRSYSEEAGDFARLCRLITAGRREAWRRTTWCLGRAVDWKYGLWGAKLDQPGFCDRNAELWFDAFGDLAGLAISENGGADFAVITRQGYRFLFPELLDWALDAWGDREPRCTVELTEHQELEARAAEQRGFRPGAPYLTRRFDLAAPPAPAPLEPGFAIVDMAAHPDYRARRILRANAFDGPKPLGDQELRELLRVDTYALGSPFYVPHCDLCVMAPDGQLVAGCEGLVDPHNAEADLERVCAHSQFRGRGFARAVIVACMARLGEMGMRRAYITGYSEAAIALYRSLGPAEELRCVTYERS